MLEVLLDSDCGAEIAQGVVSVLVSFEGVSEIVVSELSGGAHVVDMGGEKVHTIGVWVCDRDLLWFGVGVRRGRGSGVAGCG